MRFKEKEEFLPRDPRRARGNGLKWHTAKEGVDGPSVAEVKLGFPGEVGFEGVQGDAHAGICLSIAEHAGHEDVRLGGVPMSQLGSLAEFFTLGGVKLEYSNDSAQDEVDKIAVPGLPVATLRPQCG